eukprot:Blabericola_migrator_1__3283@NODE_1968_length_3487_cov_234_827485_g1252_i0_p1_GENE_NODE_1968_length_3487_cov_234_827485_g1252_i0NODE_1968_length_3487_cov_234_827485_g1252_i0_p1_ORF_typecomplete_len696_score102_78SNF5/PF04855_12/4_1e06PBP1_TM/PF14812_6/1_7_NODE_1968_length_3487_cov_234_827485_g1252_i09153002
MVSDRKRHAPTMSGGLVAEAQNIPGVGPYENQIYSEPWGQTEPDVDSDEDKIDRALAMEVNIPLDHKGELVTFREVRTWKVPSLHDLTKLKHRINEEWIKPLNLKQQDIVKASGLGAPYVCYLLKDPNSPNMNRRRKIEAYSVLTELFRKFDAKQVTREDFVRLKNQRLANRFSGPRQDRSGKNASAANRAQPRRRRRRNDAYGEDDEVEDEGSQVDDENQLDPSGRKRQRTRMYPAHDGSTTASMSAASLHSLNGAANEYGMQSVDPAHPYAAFGYAYMGLNYPYGDAAYLQQKTAGMYGYPPHFMPMVPPNGFTPNPHMASQYPVAGPMIASPIWPPQGYNPKLARGQGLQTETGEIVDAALGRSFQAPYPPGFPPVTRTITAMPDNVIDGPPSTTLAADRFAAPKVNLKPVSSSPTASNAPTGIKREGAHDMWIRDKVSQLARPVVIPKTEQGSAVFREPITHSFVFLVEKDSCLLPIGVKVMDGPPVSTDELWDIKALRRDAEKADWLDENRDWDESLWVLWDIRETGSAVSALLEKLRQDHNLNDAEYTKVARCFMSQYVAFRDVELSFRALQEYAAEREDFCRSIEINCDLLEERLRVRDRFYWDIRASDWDLTALLSNFVSDFELDSPAISSLFIDLKTTILRHRKEWVTRMLERLTHDGNLDASRFLPGSLGLEPHSIAHGSHSPEE